MESLTDLTAAASGLLGCPAWQALEKFDIQLLFQLLQQVARGGLRHVHRVRRASQIPEFTDGIQ